MFKNLGVRKHKMKESVKKKLLMWKWTKNYPGVFANGTYYGRYLCMLVKKKSICLPLVIFILVFLFLRADQEENEEDTFVASSNLTNIPTRPSWIYECKPNMGCQRLTRSQFGTVGKSSYFESLSHCMTICDQFGGLWPRPIKGNITMRSVQIHPSRIRFDIAEVPKGVRQTLTDMVQIFRDNIDAECGGNVTDMVDNPVVIYLLVKSDDLSLSWDTNEAYVLDVETKQENVVVCITANTIYGVRHALESFTQLIASDKPDYTDRINCGIHVISDARIEDRPVHKHRGLLLDTSRNFIPLQDIKRTIDGLAAVKMNVFHWHMTDSHSFPLESKQVPQLSSYGAYSANEVYTTEEVRELIEYARIRGVRVVIEIDGPAHAANGWQWGQTFGLGNLAVCVNAHPWETLCKQPPCGQLNPANPHMYNVLRSLYRELIGIMPQPALLHMGGDEVIFKCWNSTMEIITYMKQQGYELDSEGYFKLWAEYHNKSLKIWDEELHSISAKKIWDKKLHPISGKPDQSVMLWSSSLTRPKRIKQHLDPNRFVIEVWAVKADPMLNDLLKLGYRVVAAPHDVWYLDIGHTGRGKVSHWKRMYSYVLPAGVNLLGGEVALWTEFADGQVLDSRLWPRTAAVAERLWSDPSSKAKAATTRLKRLRARLIARGLRPDTIAPTWCKQHAEKCP